MQGWGPPCFFSLTPKLRYRSRCTLSVHQTFSTGKAVKDMDRVYGHVQDSYLPFQLWEHAVHCMVDPGFKHRHDHVRDILYNILWRAVFFLSHQSCGTGHGVPYRYTKHFRLVKKLKIGFTGFLQGSHACSGFLTCHSNYGEHVDHCKVDPDFKHRHDHVRDILYDIL